MDYQTTISTTLNDTRGGVCILELECTVDVDYDIEFDTDEDGRKIISLADWEITAFVFEEKDQTARVESGDDAFNYFKTCISSTQIRESLEDQLPSVREYQDEAMPAYFGGYRG